MDPLIAVSLVGTIVQLVEFSGRLLSKAVEIHRDGALAIHIDTETATSCLLELNGKIQATAGTAGLDPALGKLCQASHDVANELLAALSNLKVHGEKGRWKSMRAALQSVLSKNTIDGLEKRLSKFQTELNLRIIADLRERIDLVSLQGSDQFQHLNTRTREILDAAINNQDIFKRLADSHVAAIQQVYDDMNNRIIEQNYLTRSTIIGAVESTSRQSIEEHEFTRQDLQLHTDVLGKVQAETNTTVVEQHEQTRTQVIEMVQLVDQRNIEEHEITRREISQLKQALEHLKEEFRKKDTELKEFLRAFSRERSPRKRKQWQKLSNAASAALLKLESLCRILFAVLASLQARAKAMWGPSNFQGSVESHNSQAVSTIAFPDAIALQVERGHSNRTPTLSHDAAIHLYYHYFYHHLSTHDDLIDINQMERQWKPRNPIDHSEMSSHIECFSVHGSNCSVPSVWLMAAVIAAFHEYILPASDVYSMIAEVFERSRQSLMVDGTFTEGSRASRLHSDFDFWKQFSQSRHLDHAVDKYLATDNFIKSRQPFGSADKEEMTSFLVWLIGNKEKPKDNVRPMFSVRSTRVFVAALSMQLIGVRIATWTDQNVNAQNPNTHNAVHSRWPLVAHGDLKAPFRGGPHVSIHGLGLLEDVDLEANVSGDLDTARNKQRYVNETGPRLRAYPLLRAPTITRKLVSNSEAYSRSSNGDLRNWLMFEDDENSSYRRNRTSSNGKRFEQLCGSNLGNLL